MHASASETAATSTGLTLRRALGWTAGVCAGLLLAALFIAVFGWNWLRGPIQRLAAEKTGRALAIKGDLSLKFGWSLPHIHAREVAFANPPWAEEQQMVVADGVDIALDLPQLLRQNIVIPEVWLERPVVFLEQGSEGR